MKRKSIVVYFIGRRKLGRCDECSAYGRHVRCRFNEESRERVLCEGCRREQMLAHGFDDGYSGLPRPL